MTAHLSGQQKALLKTRLEQRRSELLETICRELLASDNETYIDLAGTVHDSGEESVADLLADLGFADIGREVNEVRDIEQALMRMAIGAYGVCIDCEADIPFERLAAYPTAKRCLACQQKYEAGKERGMHPSL